MLKNCWAPVLALVLALLSTTAHAFFDSPYVTPASPTTGETVSVNIRGGVCDAIISTPGYPQISREGNAIRVVLYGVHVSDSDFCIYPIGTATFPVEAYPVGTYALRVDLDYDNYPFGPATETLGNVPFVVAGSIVPATSVPTNNPLDLLTLILVLSALAIGALRARQPGMLLLVVVAFAPLGAHAQAAPPSNIPRPSKPRQG